MILKNKNNELRSGFKIIVFFFLYVVFNSILSGAIGGLVGGYISAKYNSGLAYEDIYALVQNFLTNSMVGLCITQMASIISLILTLFIILKFIEKKSLRDFGIAPLRFGWKQILWGMLFGAVSISVIAFVLKKSGNIYFSNALLSPQFTKSALLGILLFIIVAINEEVMCRGYIYNTLNQMGRPWLSACISSGIFAALHLTNPNVSLFAVLNIFLVGILFCYMVMKTNNLWMAIGFHFTWNYFQGNVFGFPVSGLTGMQSLYEISYIKENIFTGGFFGPEAGILASIVLVINIGLVWLFFTKPNTKSKVAKG